MRGRGHVQRVQQAGPAVHITIRSTPVQSTALCEHIYTVDKSRLEKFVGRCTKSEMAAVDIGIISGLGLGAYDLARPAEEHPVSEPFQLIKPDLELAIVQVERDTYKRMYESLLDRMTMERRAGA